MTTDYYSDELIESNEQENDFSYAFDPTLIEQQGHSLVVILEAKLCPNGQQKLNTSDEKITFKALRKIFREQCAGAQDFLSPQHPILESAVRILLSSKTESLKLSELHSKISALWLTSTWPRHMSKDAMRRVLDNATSFGIIRV